MAGEPLKARIALNGIGRRPVVRKDPSYREGAKQLVGGGGGRRMAASELSSEKIAKQSEKGVK